MVSAVVTFGMIFLLISSGRIFEGVKRLIQLFIDIFLKIGSACGLRISKTEKRIHVTRQFKNTFKDIRVVKKSKQNNKLKPSINLFALILLLSSITLIICNLEVVTGNAISIWLFDHNPFPQFITSQRNMDMTFTASLFSIVTFSISKLINQWKETKKDRKARREVKKQKKVLKNISSRDLLDIAKSKDLERYNQLIKKEEEE